MGPRTLKNVLTPSSLLGTDTFFMDSWNRGANMKPRPDDLMHSSTCAGGRSIGTPSADNTSADPDRLEIDRFPCFATGTPTEAVTNEAAVLMLNEFDPSPPVPQRSTQSFGTVIFADRSRIAVTNPTSSCSVSPFIRIAVMN